MSDMPSDRTAIFIKNLATLCEGYGRSSKLAAEVGIARQHLWRITHGQVVPSLELAMRIAEVTEISLHDLLFTEIAAEKV